MSISKQVLWEQGRHGEMMAVGVDRLTEEVKGVSALHATGLPDGKQPRPKNQSLVAAGTITYFSCLHRRTNRTFGEVIGGFNPLGGKKDKKMLLLPIFMRTCLAYCLHTTLRNLARGRASGLTSDAILKKLSNIQMIDIHLPTTDGRHIVMSRYTQPEKDVSLLFSSNPGLVKTGLGLSLPDQPPPKVYASEQNRL